MAFSGYGNVSMPVAEPHVFITGADGGQRPYDEGNYPDYNNFGYTYATDPGASTLPRAFSGMHERSVPPNGLYPPRSGPSPGPRQDLHVITNIPPANSSGLWNPRSSGMPFVQSPSSYSQPSPSPHAIPSTPRCKLVEITLDGVNFTPMDLTRHTEAEGIRRDIISRLLPTASSIFDYDIFRTHPSRVEAALNDSELMLDIGHFGDDRWSLKFLVQVADRHSDSHLPTYVRARSTSSLHSHSYLFSPSANPSVPSPHSSIAGSGGWHGSNVSTPDTGVYPPSPSQPPRSYPSGSVSMPAPMHMQTPAPLPVRQLTEPGTPMFPNPDHSNARASMSTRPPPTPSNSWAPSFVEQPGFINPARSPSQFDNAVEVQQSQHYYGEETSAGSFGNVHGRASRDSTVGADSQRSSVVIGGTMSTDEVLSHLYERGCGNVTNQLEESRISRDPVARGGGGDVHSGQLRCGRRVALKCVRLAIGSEDGYKLKKTAHELYVWSKCKHRNVLELIGVTRYRNQVAMVSPWMENGDLRTFLRLKPKANRHDLCVQMADGVAYLHEQTIVHGDIKGANILISQDHTIKITDFGTSALKNYTLEFAATGSKPGLSTRWAAPEILEEKSGNSYEADVYALAMTILEAITGAVPYVNVNNDVVVIRKITHGEVPVRPEAHIPNGDYYSDRLWSLLNRCWVYNYRSRPSAVELQHQLRVIVS